VEGGAESIAELEARRDREHRITGTPMRNVRQLRSWVRDRRIVLMTGKAAVPNMADAIAGRVLRGSWMANPEVHLIYRLISRLEGFVSAPLVLGKSTTLDPSLTDAFYSVAADPRRQAAARSELSRDAARLLELLDGRPEVRMDAINMPTKQSRKARLELEREFLVHSYDIHTERGSHSSVIAPWESSELAQQHANRPLLPADEAADVLTDAAVRSAVLAPEREVHRWFTGSAAALARLLDAGRCGRHVAGKQSFITVS
jgi:hypothetical protein